LNAHILFTDEKDLEASALYNPIKSVVPSILPSILKDAQTDDAVEAEITEEP